MNDNKKDYLWDIEVFPNLFLLNAEDVNNPEDKESFQISPYKDNRYDLVEWLRTSVNSLIGFNTIGYDYPILHNLITTQGMLNNRGSIICNYIYNLSCQIVSGKRINIPETSYIVKQVDLFRINHFNNKARMVGLKELEFNFRMKNIQELPYNPNKPLTQQQILKISQYCFNDIEATRRLYEHTIPEIELRDSLNKKYKTNEFTNYDSVKIGEEILLRSIQDNLGKDALYETIYNGTDVIQKMKQSPRDKIELKKIIFPYIEFETKEFNALLSWFKEQIISELNGAFTNLKPERLKSLYPYYVVDEVTTTKNGEKIKLQRNVNVLFKEERYDFGTGGAHASTTTDIYKSDDDRVIIDLDVASFYPNLAIKNKIYPEHFSDQYCDTYEGVYLERKKYPKGTAENLAYKLALNGSYGKSNSPYSNLYDPQYTISITLNGQLSLMMLVERVLMEIPSAKMLQVNTDGATFMVDRKDLSHLENIKQRWEKVTQLELEETIYQKMIIVNVSNYIAIKEDGKVKRKGTLFIYKDSPGELELYKNHSNLVTPMAIEAYFVNGTDPEEFLKNHDNIYDFFLRTKVNRDTYVLEREFNGVRENRLQGISRYLVTGEIKEVPEYINGTRKERKELRDANKHLMTVGYGNELIKSMPPTSGKKSRREFAIEKGYLCEVYNDLRIFTEQELKSRIYYPYYLEQIYKVIKQFNN